jgi:Tol biopolymer transport system component
MKKYRPKVSFAAALLALTLFAAANVPAQSFTLEQVMGSPFPSELTASNRGDRVAWAFAAEGKRNIWMAESPSFAARQLTRYDKDDGGALSQLAFAPNGNVLAYVRGEGRNQAGEYPNPTTDSEGTSQQVWVVDVRTGRTTLIGEGNTPTFTATGSHVVWMRNGEFLAAPAGGGKERVLFAMRGDVSGPQWSRDGTQLAFVSTRNDHSFISIYEPWTNQLRFIAPASSFSTVI